MLCGAAPLLVASGRTHRLPGGSEVSLVEVDQRADDQAQHTPQHRLATERGQPELVQLRGGEVGRRLVDRRQGGCDAAHGDDVGADRDESRVPLSEPPGQSAIELIGQEANRAPDRLIPEDVFS
jgi:hypothetical protein